MTDCNDERRTKSRHELFPGRTVFLRANGMDNDSIGYSSIGNNFILLILLFFSFYFMMRPTYHLRNFISCSSARAYACYTMWHICLQILILGNRWYPEYLQSVDVRRHLNQYKHIIYNNL